MIRKPVNKFRAFRAVNSVKKTPTGQTGYLLINEENSNGAGRLPLMSRGERVVPLLIGGGGYEY